MRISSVFIQQTSPTNALQRYNITPAEHNNISLNQPKVRQSTALDTVRVSTNKGINLNLQA